MNDNDEATRRIDRYIDATRCNFAQRIQPLIYESRFERAIEISHGFESRVRIRLAYSATRRAEHVLLEGNSWLIYDQYMGQTMNLLNRIYIEAEDHHPAEAYTHKIAAERLLELGRTWEALVCAKAYNAERHELHPKRSNELKRIVLTGIQEDFYLYHELAHQIYRDTRKLLPVKRAHVDDLLGAQAAFMSSRSVNSDIADYRSAPAAARHHLPMEQIEREVRSQHASDGYAEYVAAYLDASKTDLTREEIFCDVFASDILVSDNPKAINETLTGIYVGFYHLQVLSYIDRSFSAWNKRDELLTYMANVQLRHHCLKAHLLFLLELQLSGQNLEKKEIALAVESLAVELMEIQKRYYESIFDPLMAVCDNLSGDSSLILEAQETECRVLSLAEDHSLPIEHCRIATESAVRALTGWPITHTSLTYPLSTK